MLMLRRLSVLAILLLLLGSREAGAWGGGGGGGGGGGSSMPPPPAAPPPPPSQPIPPALPPTESHVVNSVSYHVSAASKDGLFPVKDALAQGRQWQLKSTGSPRPEKLDDKHYRVKVEFEGSLQGDAKTFPVVLEFYLTGQDKDWKVTDVWIREVNRIERARTHACPQHPTVGTFEAGRACPVDGQKLP